MREIKTVALIGLGAIGSFLASNLHGVLGENLRIVAGGARKERRERDGIVVNGVPFHFRVVAPEEETGYADLAIVITKITGLSQALEDMRRQIGPDTIIMSPLNGVESEERVAAVYGWDRVLYSLARVSVVMDGNQVSYNSSRASIEFGEKYNQEPSERVLAVKHLLESAGIRPVIQPDMEKALWMKFVCNVSENQVGAVLHIPFGAWNASEHANALRLMVAKEVIDIARKKGIDIDDDYAVRQLEQLKKVPYANKPSTLQDIEHGRKTEVEMFAGTVIRLGKETGVPTPLNEFLYHAVRVLEEKNEGII